MKGVQQLRGDQSDDAAALVAFQWKHGFWTFMLHGCNDEGMRKGPPLLARLQISPGVIRRSARRSTAAAADLRGLPLVDLCCSCGCRWRV